MNNNNNNNNIKNKIETIKDIPVDEQETTIIIERASENCTIYTSMNTWVTKLNKLLSAKDTKWKILNEHRDKDGNLTGVTVTGPKELVKIRPKKKTLTDTQISAFVQNFSKNTGANVTDITDADDNNDDNDED